MVNVARKLLKIVIPIRHITLILTLWDELPLLFEDVTMVLMINEYTTINAMKMIILQKANTMAKGRDSDLPVITQALLVISASEKCAAVRDNAVATTQPIQVIIT